jgi:hypothetical protein
MRIAVAIKGGVPWIKNYFSGIHIGTKKERTVRSMAGDID